MIYGLSDKVSVRIFDGKCEIDFSLVYPRLHVTGTYNLLNNAAIFVQKGIGAAICFEVGNHYDELTFVPMKPALHSGCVLIWRKNEALSETVKKFLDVFSEKEK